MAETITDENAAAYYAKVRRPGGGCYRCNGAGFVRVSGETTVRACGACNRAAATPDPVDAGPAPWAK